MGFHRDLLIEEFNAWQEGVYQIGVKGQGLGVRGRGNAEKPQDTVILSEAKNRYILGVEKIQRSFVPMNCIGTQDDSLGGYSATAGGWGRAKLVQITLRSFGDDMRLPR
jgi:hypothetical protein